MKVFIREIYSLGTIFLYPVVPSSFSFAFKITTKGKCPLGLNLSASSLFCSESTFDNLLFFFRGKSAR